MDVINKDYVDYIRYKYRLAIIIAVIRTKPENKTMEEHINNLKHNFIEMNSCKITICEEDFNLSDNESEKSVTILKDFSLNNVDDVESIENGVQADKQNLEKSITNFNSQSTYYETPQCNTNMDENTYYSSTQDTILENSILNMTTPSNDLQVTTEFYPYELTDKHTHISQSQDNLIICNKYLLSKDGSKNGDNSNIAHNKLNLYNNNNVQNNIDFSKESHIVNEIVENFDVNDKTVAVDVNNVNNINNFSLDLDFLTEICIDNSKKSENSRANSDIFALDLSTNTINNNNQNKQSKKVIPFSQNDIFLDEIEYFTDSSQITLNSIQNDRTKKDIDITNEVDLSKIKDISDRKRKVSETDLEVNKVDDRDFSSLKDVTESQVEEVTFKVLEELNKVKNYLNRRERDSERWRSSQLDTFSRVSDTSVSVSNVSESAHCLLRHITSSALLSKTANITSHVSEALGQLINALHEDEKYPSFLENLLKTIDNLLHYIYEGDNCEENIIIKKEQAINRIYLLNRSTHIIEYTIQTITSILQKTIQDFKGEEYEVRFPDKAENVCHILHILQVMLKRHTQKHTDTQKQTNTQSSQSQELKKSVLTELWRRKWSGETESVIVRSGESGERVLKECSGVLRTLLVEGMNGYGLISFCALNCYNLLQN